MDSAQRDHLRAYGVAYNLLKQGITVEWLLYYRGGSFLTEASRKVKEMAVNWGVSYEVLSSTEVSHLYQEIEIKNMNSIVLEVAPKIAVYIPPYAEPWDDAVVLALEYARIPYDRIWDDAILEGNFSKYDWVHLHHEDFSGQYGKFYSVYKNADWYKEMERIDRETALKYGFPNAQKLKQAVSYKIREYVKEGGFLFSMCSGPITMDISLAAGNTDIWDSPFDGTPYDAQLNEKLNYSETMAFENFKLYPSAFNGEHSDIDITDQAVRRGPKSFFTLFEFSAKYDPVPSMLVQNHTNAVKEFLGRDTGFREGTLKSRVVILGKTEGTDETKYIYANFGKGFFTYLGGHDPEDYQHFIGDPPTDLSRHPSSPGYRLILNNVLFPASQPQKLKT